MRVVLAACLVLAGCAGRAGHTWDRLANSGPWPHPHNLPTALAQALGFFAQEGLDVWTDEFLAEAK